MSADDIDLLDLDREELRALLEGWGEPSYRGDQLFEWLHRHQVVDPQQMTNLSKGLRQRLAERATIGLPEVASIEQSRDGTRKYLLRGRGGSPIEAVMIPDQTRRTLCVSTQVGCPLACTFCLTGRSGFARNLTAGEIVGQVLVTERDLGPDEPLTNLVYMGMGEPLLNFEGTLKATQMLLDEQGRAFPPSRITLSTVGLPERMRLFMQAARVNLAVSLHAPDNSLRSELMPINKGHDIEAVLQVVEELEPLIRGRVTFEYVLLEGVNDRPEHADALARRVGSFHCKVNLIPFNPHQGSPYRRPSKARIEAFRKRLVAQEIDAYVRKSRGDDISAACGQLMIREADQPGKGLPVGASG